MHVTSHDLPESTRVPLVNLLNNRLADAILLGIQARQAHWNVRGPRFLPLHEFFETVADQAAEHADLLAERAAQLGGIAYGSIDAVRKNSVLPPYADTIVTGADHLRHLAAAVAVMAKEVRDAIDRAAELGDAGTADLFTEISRALDKTLWFIEAHRQAEH